MRRQMVTTMYNNQNNPCVFFREKRSKKVGLVLSDLKTPVNITFSLFLLVNC